MTLSVPKERLKGGYEQYRKVRTNMLQTYCLATLKKFPQLKRIIGIAMEPPPRPGEQVGSSEDMIVIEQQIWTSKMNDDLAHDCATYDIMREGRFTTNNMDVTEYPD